MGDAALPMSLVLFRPPHNFKQPLVGIADQSAHLFGSLKTRIGIVCFVRTPIAFDGRGRQT